MTNLRIDWATHAAAKFACEHFHYSKSLPAGKSVKVGAWEDDQFIGVVIFSRGATQHIGSPYGLTQKECCELTRVALTKHKSFVSEILAKALKFLKEKSPNIQLVVSYADVEQNHHGGIYQATNWVYEGRQTASIISLFMAKRRMQSLFTQNTVLEVNGLSGFGAILIQMQKSTTLQANIST